MVNWYNYSFIHYHLSYFQNISLILKGFGRRDFDSGIGSIACAPHFLDEVVGKAQTGRGLRPLVVVYFHQMRALSTPTPNHMLLCACNFLFNSLFYLVFTVPALECPANIKGERAQPKKTDCIYMNSPVVFIKGFVLKTPY